MAPGPRNGTPLQSITAWGSAASVEIVRPRFASPPGLCSPPGGGIQKDLLGQTLSDKLFVRPKLMGMQQRIKLGQIMRTGGCVQASAAHQSSNILTAHRQFDRMPPSHRSSFSQSQTRNPPTACQFHSGWFHGIGPLVPLRDPQDPASSDTIGGEIDSCLVERRFFPFVVSNISRTMRFLSTVTNT